MSLRDNQDTSLEGIAIIGMAGRFPGAESVADFWSNQLNGIEAISRFRVEELEVPGASEAARNSNYVRARSILDNVDLFDAEFFGIYPREAELMDPQQRLFLESCWQAFEDAGYDPFSYTGSVGVYAGCSMGTYFLSNACNSSSFIRKFTGAYQVENYSEMMGNSRDFLATRVSYKLNLRGPSFTLQSGCSTSLVAVTLGCQSLLTYQCDMVLAGGSSITFPQKRGSLYQEGGMVSPDGHCRTFDADAQGTVFGSGVSVVLLKRVEDAIRDGDQIYAVIRGFALNNDGSAKIGYTAPSVEGQSNVIALALEAANIDPETIGYIEAHGTATPLGDPIELTALSNVFRVHGEKRKQFCTIGSAKTNVGHLDIAAGVTGLIHAAHIVRHGVFPPTLHFRKSNANFDLENSPFRVNTERSEWKDDSSPRRAGVSAFGVGGTNAHVVIEQAPEQGSLPTVRPEQLIVLSARSEAALDRASERLAAHLQTHPDINIADTSWTLQIGRRPFNWRRALVARSVDEAVNGLIGRDQKHAKSSSKIIENPAVYFLFPGQGSQHPNMAREIYQTENIFRSAVDKCAEILQPHLGTDIRKLLYLPETATEEAKRRVTETVIAQPAIFAIEYALAQLWMDWGVRPQAMLGHSVGEFVAACLSGVFSLEDALSLVASRGRLMQEMPCGGMLSVRLPESEIRVRLNKELSIAAVNSPLLCVVAGPIGALDQFERDLSSEGVACRRLVTSHAFHSAMMDPLIERYSRLVAKIRLNRPQIPYISGVTGQWITESEVLDPVYWGKHIREAVQFSAGVTELRKNPNALFLEVGPGSALNVLTRQHVGPSDQIIVSSLSGSLSGKGDYASLMDAMGALWAAGINPDWRRLYTNEHRRRISLPTYPFDRKRFWWREAASTEIEVDNEGSAEGGNQSLTLMPASSASLEGKTKMNNLTPPTSNAIGTGRAERIRAALVEIFQDLSGMDLASSDRSATFLDLGFDSLFLTQVTQALQSQFGLKITFRQLLADEATLDALTRYLDKNIPAKAFAEVQPAPIASLSAGSETTSIPIERTDPAIVGVHDNSNNGSPVERLMRDQLQAMNELFAKQLEILRGSAPTHADVPVSAKVVTSAVPKNDSKLPQKETATPVTDGFKAHGPYRPVQKTTSADLTPHQVKRLDELIARHTKRTAKSKALTQAYRQVLADPRVVSGFRPQWKEIVYPIVTERSQGSRIWDVDGNEYIDLVNGFGPIMLGHRPEFVEKAIEKQLHEGFETGPQSPLAGEVAQMFCEITGNERMTFCNTGSEAVMAALRIARTVTGRNKVVFFSGDYHGMFDEVLVKGFKNKAGEPQSAPIAPGIPRENVSNIVVLNYGAAESLDWIRRNAESLAAVLVEPVQSRHPDLQPIEFLRDLRRITQDSGAALIFDEVVTGFRVHPGGCQALFGIRADLATYGKVVAGGMPIGILAGTSRFMDALDGGSWQYGDGSFPAVGVTFFAGTFVRHPLALAACKAVLQHFKEQGSVLQERLNERTTRLVKRLNEFLQERGVPTRIEQFGSIFYLGLPSTDRCASLFYYCMADKGIHIREGFPFFLTTAHSGTDIQRIIEAFEASIIEMQEAQFISDSIDQKIPSDGTASLVAEGQSLTEVPMTEPQREIFLAARLGDEASCSFNESFSLHLHGPLELENLRRSVNAVVKRHEALRTVVDAEGMRLRFRPEVILEIPLRDFSGIEPAARNAELKRVLEEHARTPFDLTEGPLIRSELLRLAPDQHTLVFTSHHIVCDGWSTNVLLSELAELYSSQIQGRSAELPQIIPFSKYAREQLLQGSSVEGSAVESYWLDQFKHLPAPLDLPVDRPRPTVKGYSGTTFRTHIGAEWYGKIKQLGSKKGCTPFITLLAGFQALLHRLAQQEEIVVGIPTAGQSLIEGGNLVGHCVNFLPVRARFNQGLSFAGLLSEVKKAVLDAYDHQSYTYGTLVRKLAIQRNPSRLPLMEVQFNFERIGSGAVFHGLQMEVDPNPKAAVNFDIFFNVVEGDEGLTIDCDYNTDLFDEATITRWLKHYETLLLSAASAPEQAVEDLALMSPAETTAVIARCNRNQPTPIEHHTIHRLFENQAEQVPNAIAVQMGGDQLTYRELDNRANQLARALQRAGVKSGSLVAVSFERSVEMIVAFLGVLKAGGAYLPIDSSYPLERLAMIFDDAQPSVLITQERLVASLPRNGTKTLCLDKDWLSIAAEDPSQLRQTSGPDNIAYVIYTSGSTGRPKGVPVTHQNVVRLLKATEPWFQFDTSDVWTLFHSYAFDFSVWEMWGCLLTGGRLIVVPYWVTRSPQDFYNLLAEHQVTVLNQTPAAFNQLIQVENAGIIKTLALRYVIFGGETLNFSQLGPWFERHGDRSPQLINMYGITETTVHVTYRPLTKADAQFETRSLIGVPIPDVQLYLLDARNRPVPPGVVGEIYVGGAGVANGYLNRPELTAERFVENPFSGNENGRMYRSGDLARLLNSGDIEYLGRGDTQVKVHGFRIELGEIEAALTQHPGVQHATVIARRDERSENKLTAYVVTEPNVHISSSELRDYLQSKLPAHMIPHACVVLDEMPLTVNGKIDRTRLPLPEMDTSRVREFVAPRSAQEKLLCDIFAEVLGVKQVGMTDNLFELGADSLHVFQITSRSEKAGLPITPKLVLQHRTVDSILKALVDIPTAISPPIAAITRVERQKYRVSQGPS